MKKTVVFLLLAALLFSQACFAWEPVIDITVYSGPGYEYASEAYALPKDWTVQVRALARDRLDCVWAHISYTGRDSRVYMAYTPINTLNLEKQDLLGFSYEPEPGSTLVVLTNTYVYYGPSDYTSFDTQYTIRTRMLATGTYISLIDTKNDYYFVEYEEDGFKVRGYVPTFTAVASTIPSGNSGYDYWETPPSDDNGSWDDYGYGTVDPANLTTVRASKTNTLVKERIYESSHLTNKWNDYKPENAFDNKKSTDWVEGSKRYGLNDYVGCVWQVTDSSLAAYGIAIRGGMQYNGTTSWNRNQRPKNITVTVNGKEHYFVMEDKMDEQVFYFDSLIRPDANGRIDLKVMITSTYFMYNEDGTRVSEYNIAINDIDLILAKYSYTTVRATQTSKLVKERVYESSHLTNKWNNYKPEYAFDNKKNTDWVEGSGRYGLNDYVGCVWRVTDSTLAAYGIAIRGGMQYNGTTSWNRNQRPKNITVTVNGQEFYFIMEDTMDEQIFNFGSPIWPDANGRIDLKVMITSTHFMYNEDGTRVSEYNIAINDIDLILAKFN